MWVRTNPGPVSLAKFAVTLVLVSACGPSAGVDRGSLAVADAAVDRPARVARAEAGPSDAPPTLGPLPDAAVAGPAGDAGRPPPPPDGSRSATEAKPGAPGSDAAPDTPSGAPPDAAADAIEIPPGPDPLQLPLLLTDHFSRQGWFGDEAVAAYFDTGVGLIHQVPSTAGPCAVRNPGARGQCVEVTYTPPSDLTAGAGGWVGAYFLSALRQDHPEQSPPLRAGQANWGIEPGPRVVPGARRMSFLAAGPDGLSVSFQVGSNRDSFVLPERTERLSTGWVRHTISLEGARYDRVVTPFAWLLKDTNTPARFYLDDIVWEP